MRRRRRARRIRSLRGRAARLGEILDPGLDPDTGVVLRIGVRPDPGDQWLPVRFVLFEAGLRRQPAVTERS